MSVTDRGRPAGATRPARTSEVEQSVVAPLIDRVESAARLDPAGKAIGRKVRALVSPGALKDVLSGTWLGHALHPALTDIVVGSLLSATLLDLLGGDADGRRRGRLIGIGLAAAVPTALTGALDYGDSELAGDAIRRTGVVHAGSNTAALSLYVASLTAGRRGARRTGVLFGLGGAAMLSAGAYLGGHLSFSRGVGPDQTVYDPGPQGWTSAADGSELPDGQVLRVVVGDTPILLLRDRDNIYAIHDRCSHRGCSLSATGDIDGERIVCGCHGSTFDLRDGSIQRGPATAPQPAFEARERDGRIELRRREAISKRNRSIRSEPSDRKT